MTSQATSISAADKVAILAEALPYIRRFSGITIVIKYGGNAMIDDTLKQGFAQDVALLKRVGLNPVIVHGGGPQINQWLERVGKKGKFIQGMRVTDEDTMTIVEMVLGGAVNKEIVSLLNLNGAAAIGISGRDAHCIHAKKLQLSPTDATPIDLGQVGEISHIDGALIQSLVAQGFVPVIAPIGVGENGKAFNINADVVAGKVAQAIGAQKLVLITNTPGVLDHTGQLLSQISAKDVDRLIANGTIKDGMLPKIQAALDAVAEGLRARYVAGVGLVLGVVGALMTASVLIFGRSMLLSWFTDNPQVIAVGLNLLLFAAPRLPQCRCGHRAQKNRRQSQDNTKPL